MEKIDIAFVVLTYRNTTDIKDFLKSVKENIKCVYKIIIVDSFYSLEVKEEIMNIAYLNDCDFISVDNLGYGYGNNVGIEYAKKNYKFEFLVVSNPDIEIISFEYEQLKSNEDKIIAPSIITLNNKKQNPYYFRKSTLVEYLKYVNYKYDIKILSWISIILNKLQREFGLIITKFLKIKRFKIYAPHGSFIIFGNKVFDKLDKIFDERMFLFGEENHIANQCAKKNIEINLFSDIKILHKEDGSFSLMEDTNTRQFASKSYLIYYVDRNIDF